MGRGIAAEPDEDGEMTLMQDWTSKAQDRKQWKEIIEAFALQWDDTGSL